MNAQLGIRDAGRGAKAPGIDLRALDRLGITRLATDSRRVKRGDTFVAYPGVAQDGRRYIPQAIANGARSVLWERRGFRWRRAWRVPNLGVFDLRRHAGEIASHVYGNPSARLWMIGVTGTNGKTTCSQWIGQALDDTGMRSAVIGTLGYGLVHASKRTLRALTNTTPDAVWLHGQLARFARRGARAVSMEVSSIGLDQDRVSGVQFDVALFTNLTRDHLDYHGTMRRYRLAKARLFACESLEYAVVNLDDAFGADLARRLKRDGLSVIGYGFQPSRDRNPSRVLRVTGSRLVADARAVRFHVTTPWGSAEVKSPVLGRFNGANLLATLAVLLASGVGLDDAARALARLQPVPGRMQTVGGGTRPLVVVDYSHTPDALTKALLALRELTRNRASRARHPPRIICVFGCGGERDRGKRPLMGHVAARLADWVIITNDNPRGEDPLAILDDILAGVESDGQVELDRRRAITHAIDTARRHDIVLIAGKGHETYQETNGVRRPFSDVAVAQAAIDRWAP